ncbi:hypothetical protein [Bacillus pumilus]|nr:hypothetical protein [Bacillus pumilus]
MDNRTVKEGLRKRNRIEVFRNEVVRLDYILRGRKYFDVGGVMG